MKVKQKMKERWGTTKAHYERPNNTNMTQTTPGPWGKTRTLKSKEKKLTLYSTHPAKTLESYLDALHPNAPSRASLPAP